MQTWQDYQQKNKERFLNEMMELLRIPSVSAKTENKKDMSVCAQAVRKSLLEAGADQAEIMQGLDDGDTLVAGGVVGGRRDQRKSVVKVGDTEVFAAKKLAQFAIGARVPHGRARDLELVHRLYIVVMRPIAMNLMPVLLQNRCVIQKCAILTTGFLIIVVC